MQTTFLSEAELLEMLTTRINRSVHDIREQVHSSEELSDLLPELGHEIAKAVAAAIAANNLTQQGAPARFTGPVYEPHRYDRLSQCIDCY